MILIVFSFNKSSTMGAWTGFTFQWYVELFRDPEILDALRNTLLIALIASVVSTAAGTFAAIGIHNMKLAPQALVINISYLPLVNPDIVTGVSLMLLFIFLKMPLGFGTMLLAHICFDIPYVIFAVLPRLRQMNRYTYEAALDLGATPLQAVFRVIIPEIMPAIVTGALLAFTLSLDDFVISFFTTSDVQNLSILIYSMARRKITPKINALSALLFATVLGLLLLANKRSKKDRPIERRV